MKKAIIFTFMLFLTFNYLFAQNDILALKNESPPFADGERSLDFAIDIIDASTVYVFYSDNRNDLTAISLDNNGNGLSYGKAIQYESRAGTEMDCKFSFPNRSSRFPNADLFLIEEARNKPELQTNGFLSSSEREILRNPITRTANVRIESDRNPRKYRKQCMYYRVLVKNNINQREKKSAVKEFYMPDDFTIGLTGDSMAAGVGAEESSSDPCYRTNRSGQVLGVKKFMKNNPNVSVHYRHVACIGAQVEDLHAVVQDGGFLDTTKPNEDTQFNMIRDWLSENDHSQLNMLVLSIGVNNVSFGEILTKYHVLPLNFAVSEDRENIPDALVDLNTALDQLSVSINEYFPLTFTMMTSLPNVFRNRSNELCCDRLTDMAEYLCSGFITFSEQISIPLTSPPAEFEALQNDLLRPLNATLRNASNEHNWNFLNITNRSNSNGMCVCDGNGGYFWNFKEAILASGHDYNKTGHPNRAGYKAIFEDPIAYFIDEKYHDYYVPLYPFKVASQNIEIPDCQPFYSQWFQELELSSRLKLPKEVSAIDKSNYNNLKLSKKSEKVNQKNAKNFLLNSRKKAVASRQKQVKSKTIFAPKKSVLKKNLTKDFVAIKQDPLYINLINSKNDNEYSQNLQRLYAKEGNAIKPKAIPKKKGVPKILKIRQ